MNNLSIIILFISLFSASNLHAHCSDLEGRALEDCQARILYVALNNYPPWKIQEEKSSLRGIDQIYLKEFAKRLNLELKFIECPWARCQSLLEQGVIDLISSYSDTNERRKIAVFLKAPYRQAMMTFYTLASKDNTIKKYGDLKNLRIGHTRGATYFDKFDYDPTLKKITMNGFVQGLKMLANDRVDVIISAEVPADYQILKNNWSGKIKKEKYTYDSGSGTYFAISRKSNVLDRVDEFNEVNAQLIKESYIKKSIKKFKDQFQ